MKINTPMSNSVSRTKRRRHFVWISFKEVTPLGWYIFVVLLCYVNWKVKLLFINQVLMVLRKKIVAFQSCNVEIMAHNRFYFWGSSWGWYGVKTAWERNEFCRGEILERCYEFMFLCVQKLLRLEIACLKLAICRGEILERCYEFMFLCVQNKVCFDGQLLRLEIACLKLAISYEGLDGCRGGGGLEFSNQ